MPNRLAKQAACLDASPSVGIVGTAMLFVNEGGETVRTFRPPTDNPTIQQTLLAWNCIPHGGAMFRRRYLSELGGYNESLRYAQDYDLVLRISERWDALNLPETLYHYRWHAGMASLAKKREQELCVVQARQWAIKRRLRFRLAALGWRDGGDLPPEIRQASRRWLAERYTWWSMGVRGPGHFGDALQFLLIALMIDPTYLPAWKYVRGVLERKVRRLAPRKTPGVTTA